MVEKIEAARGQKETLGGVFVVYATGVPPGLGSHVHWDRRIDGQLAQAVMGIPGIKGVEFGAGFKGADLLGSQMHDAISYTPETGWERAGNQAGGIEGGMTNGEPLILRAAMKPIPTLYQGLPSVDLETKRAPDRWGRTLGSYCCSCRGCGSRSDGCVGVGQCYAREVRRRYPARASAGFPRLPGGIGWGNEWKLNRTWS